MNGMLLAILMCLLGSHTGQLLQSNDTCLRLEEDGSCSCCYTGTGELNCPTTCQVCEEIITSERNYTDIYTNSCVPILQSSDRCLFCLNKYRKSVFESGMEKHLEDTFLPTCSGKSSGCLYNLIWSGVTIILLLIVFALPTLIVLGNKYRSNNRNVEDKETLSK